MDDDVVVRAVTIGASVFITLATVTAVMLYYNTAKASVSAIGTGTNIEQRYREDIKNVLDQTEVTGAELKNILQYFYNNKDVEININRYYAYYVSGPVAPVSGGSNINSGNTVLYSDIMKNMMPNQKFKVDKTDNVYAFTLIT